jgi:hypothetical protein
MKEILVGRSHGHSCPSFSSFAAVSAGYCQRAVVGESGMIITQMRKHNRSVMVAVYGMPYAVALHKQ